MADGSDPKIDDRLRTQGLTQLVGYAELVKAGNVSRSAIERAWRGPWEKDEPRLPSPGKIGSRAVWLQEVADAWLVARVEHQRAALKAYARTNVDDLEPDQLGDAAIKLLTRAIEHNIGEPVDPGSIQVTFTSGPPSPQVTMEQLQSAESEALEYYCQLFADYADARAGIMAAFIFPTLRPIFARGAYSQALGDVFLDHDKLREFALAAMNEVTWEDGLQRLKALE